MATNGRGSIKLPKRGKTAYERLHIPNHCCDTPVHPHEPCHEKGHTIRVTKQTGHYRIINRSRRHISLASHTNIAETNRHTYAATFTLPPYWHTAVKLTGDKLPKFSQKEKNKKKKIKRKHRSGTRWCELSFGQARLPDQLMLRWKGGFCSPFVVATASCCTSLPGILFFCFLCGVPFAKPSARKASNRLLVYLQSAELGCCVRARQREREREGERKLSCENGSKIRVTGPPSRATWKLGNGHLWVAPSVGWCVVTHRTAKGAEFTWTTQQIDRTVVLGWMWVCVLESCDQMQSLRWWTQGVRAHKCPRLIGTSTLLQLKHSAPISRSVSRLQNTATSPCVPHALFAVSWAAEEKHADESYESVWERVRWRIRVPLSGESSVPLRIERSAWDGGAWWVTCVTKNRHNSGTMGQAL